MAEITLANAEVSKTQSGVTYYARVRTYVDYSITETEATATITASLKAIVEKYQPARIHVHRPEIYMIISSSGHAGYWRLNNDTSVTWGSSSIYGAATATLSNAAKTATITKTHSAQSIPVYVSGMSKVQMRYQYGAGSTTERTIDSTPSINTVYITIPAKASYAVTYNANGGQNPPVSQTKWYGETLTLSTTQPVKDGYTFKGWAVSQENANEGIVTYASGGSYTDNVSINLFAVWELIYQKPTIYKLTVERCQSDGTLDDEGSYALVSFDWAVFRSAESRYYGGNTYPYADNSVETCTVTVGTQSATPTLTGASGHSSVIVGVGSYDVDKAYDATVSITDSQEISTDNTTTVRGALPLAFFPLDYNADASAVGFFMPAPNDGSGAYFAKEVTLKSKLYIELDDNAGSGTDYEIIQALTDLGWDDLLS